MMIIIQQSPLNNPWNQKLKRSFDFIFAMSTMLLIFPWLIPIIAIIIKLDSRGPVFSSQVRIGRSSKPFSIFKFRIMYLESDMSDRKSRLTNFGKILKATGLDEFPQFFNVLIGNMSVVGPRPYLIELVNEYQEKIEQFKFRHEIKPGITGWAQVNGLRGPSAKIEKVLEYDLLYLKNWSLLFDLKCIIRTFSTPFG